MIQPFSVDKLSYVEPFDYLTNECEWDEKDVERWEDDLVHVLAQMAQDALDEL